ncbi:MAG: carbon-nitrogen hydrolase family protein [Methyloligellaceae bacterium]
MTDSKTFRASLIQLRSTRTTAPNIEAVSTFVAEAANDGADYIQTPENTALMELKSRSLFENIEPEEDNSALQAFTRLAKDFSVWLHIGGMAIRLSDKEAANRAFLIAPDGTIKARYDKIHMFDVDLPNGESYRESKNFRPGTKAVLAELPWGKIGLTICYDLRFPALYRTLAQAGAEILTVPAAFTKPTGEAHWHTLLRTRAIENGCFVMAAAQGGFHETGRATYGHSVIISPWGEILAEAGSSPGWISADIDLKQVKTIRQKLPSLQHDRDFELEKS